MLRIRISSQASGFQLPALSRNSGTVDRLDKPSTGSWEPTAGNLMITTYVERRLLQTDSTERPGEPATTARYSCTTVARPTKTAREIMAWPIDTSSSPGNV